MKSLITGVNGFVGKYLYNYLREMDKEIVGIDVQNKTKLEGIIYYQANIINKKELFDILNKNDISTIYHLAAFSNPKKSNEEPYEALNININGTINLFEYLRSHNNVKLLSVGSQLEYAQDDRKPFKKEEDLLKSKCIYSASKICTEIVGKEYVKQYNSKILFTRSFNHTGPGQSDLYAVPSFAKQIIEIKLGLRKALLKVGNIKVSRDIIDVRDVVRGYYSIVKDGIYGESYNVCSGIPYVLEDLINKMISISGCKKIDVEIKDEYIRKNDVMVIYGDNSKIKKDTGWTPEITINETLKDLLEYWENKITV